MRPPVAGRPNRGTPDQAAPARRARSRRLAGLAAAALALAFVVVYLIAVRTVVGQRWDARGFAVDGPLGLPASGSGAARTVLVVLGTVTAAILLAIAAWRRRWRVVVYSLVLVASAAVLASALKSSLPRPDLGDFAYAYNTFPSGHVTTAVALGIATVVLWPVRAQAPLVALVAAAVLEVESFANVASFAHRPADVVGAWLLAGGVAATWVAVLGPPLRDPRARDAGIEEPATMRGPVSRSS